jgi:regulator of protease activity HflC (stomatin/prohibitin superfamily)
MADILRPGNNTPDLRALKRAMGGSLLWVAVAFLLVVILLLVSVRVEQVKPTQVGMLLNKWTGEVQIIRQSGMQIYFGLAHEFHLMDKTLQTLEMLDQDALKVKTIDGSDVYVDLKVQYAILPEEAMTVLQTSGPGNAYKEKWARDFIRSISRDHLGELTTEQFYDAALRNSKVRSAKDEVNELLAPYGVSIDQLVIPKRPSFYKEYEALIKKKKLADQAVQEQESKARAAKQTQQTRIAEETNAKNVAIEKFRGQMEQKVIQAEAEGEKVRREADGYYDQTTIGADARFYELQKQAEAILARKQAEAQGIEELKEALSGEGGRNMVRYEYAKKLQGVTITGQPFSRSGLIQRFEHMGSRTAGPAAAAGARGEE